MKPAVLKSLFTLLVLACLLPFGLCAQDLTGIWKGYFVTENGMNYTLEFQIEQDRNQTVTGVSYSYGNDIKFYGKATMTGNFAVTNGSFSIQELRTVEVKTEGGTCLMNYRFTYTKSGREEYLEGTYVGKSEDRNDPRRNGVWGDCGGGKVFLRRVRNSDFYIEPFLRDKLPDTTKTVKPVIKTATPPVKKPVPTTPAKKPVAKPPVKKPVATTTAKPPVKKPLPVSKPVVTTKPVTKPGTDSLVKRSQDPIVNDRPIDKPKMNIPVTTRSRKNELVQTLTITNEVVNIRIYDNGEVDDDTISVYLDGKQILANRRLSTVPITLSVKMDEDNPEHTLVMVAENMGRIPPNTSLMIVQDGDKRYEVSITSTEQRNAMVRFRYQKKQE